MSNKTKKKDDTTTKKETYPEFFYINEDVKNYTFSNYVRLNSFPHGMVLSFGKFHPVDGKFGIFQEILLPFEVAASLSKIIKGQLDELIADGALKEIPPIKEDNK